ncbi:PREDICTED: beta-galactosidase 9 isoform X2 [Nelumbo nucifera]|uniref:Beta-galactosidase n=1 Tax=Nelumbo nucifera TaxID=4432 RepID=A0A1U8BBW8_NELNU|nr:PREDICTED: beta-galactosidase 9 isoform X2 [Nelumbo nucifera]
MLGSRALLACLVIASVAYFAVSAEFFKPFNVSYDHRALIIDGKRRMLISAGIHYPRATPEMWPDLIAKSKEGGADMIQSYVFWNGHEPIRGQYNFEGRYDIVKFVKLVGSSGLYLHLRIGPYVCAEWNFGGFPVWLRDVPGIEFRTNNAPFKEEMHRFVKMIVDLMLDEMLFSWQGGPIILLQIENEYGNIESSYGQRGKDYVKWAASMAIGLGAGVPWVMCKQTDAPENIIDACNGFYCDGFKPNSYRKPVLWTEDWNGWFASWGGRVPHRPVEDIAFAIARFFERGGSYQNYYMAHVYHQYEGLHLNQSGKEIRCSAFLANIDERKAATVKFFGRVYTLPPWSVSILPDCKNVAFNTAKVGAQTSIKSLGYGSLSSNIMGPGQPLHHDEVSFVSKAWKTIKEPIGAWGERNFTVQGLLEHLNVTKDTSDYLWYITRINMSDDDISYWENTGINPTLSINSMRDVVRIFVNGQHAGSTVGHWVQVVHPLNLSQGYNELAILSQTVGLQNSGAFLEKDGAGFKGQIKLTGLKNGEMDLTNSFWTYQVGLKGEFMKLYALENTEQADWIELPPESSSSMFTWYKTYFDVPDGVDPVALDLGTMGKGQAWVNGHNIGRHWSLVAPKEGCQNTCDYRGTYNERKCATNCGKPTQNWYHVPRSWLRASNNLLVIFEETGGNPLEIVVKSHSTKTICAQVSESYYPPLSIWSHEDVIQGKISLNDVAPEMKLRCDDGQTISTITFASYGTPQGSCRQFSMGNCHAPSSMSVVSEACQGKNSCSLNVSNAAFGVDPCHGIVKTLAVEANCISSTDSGPGVAQL